jgi:serine/threonine protein kinase
MKPADGDYLTPREIGDCLASREIQLWLCRPLNPPQRIRFYYHLDGCASCRDKVHALAEFDRLCLPQVAPEPPQLADFAIQRYLGRGRCGEAWVADRPTDTSAERCVLKIVRRDRLDEGPLGELLLWAELARAHPHPNRVQVKQAIEEEDRVILVSDSHAGGPLANRAPLAPEKAIGYIAEVAAAVADLEEKPGLCLAPEPFWCAIRPGNLLLDAASDRVRLDFDLSRFVDDGLFLGWTLGYTAPEVLEGYPTQRSAVFSLAATLCYLLTGEVPFRTDDRESYLDSVREGMPAGLEQVTLPAPLVALLRQGLAADAASRPSLAEFRQQLHTPVNLEVTISVAEPERMEFRPMLLCSRTAPATVPAEVQARTGDLIRIEVCSHTEGYLTVLVFNSTGEAELLMSSQQVCDHRLPSGENRPLTLRLDPPGGIDHTALVWTRRPVVLEAAEWKRRILGGKLAETRVANPVVMRGTAGNGEEPGTLGDDWTALLLSVKHQDQE